MGSSAWALLAMMAVACSDKTDTAGGEDSGPVDTSPATDDSPTWGDMAGQFGEGMLLSAWTDSGEVLMVGGDLKGGAGMLARYDGSELCYESEVTERALWWVHGPRDGEWYAVGEAGTVLHEVDGSRTREDLPTDATLFGVYAAGEDHVWAVGGDVESNRGEIWHRSGGSWELEQGEIEGIVFKVWENWFVGTEVLMHLEGDDLVDIGTEERLTTVRGRADDDVYAIGGSVAVDLLHWDGSTWDPVELSGSWGVGTGVFTEAGSDEVWLCGTGGFVGVYNDASEELTTPDFPFTSETFHAVWPYGDEVLFVGGNFLTSGTDYYSMLGRYGPGEKTVTPTECD